MQYLALLVGEIVGTHLAVAFEVDKQFVGVDEIEVHVVEVAQYHLAPEEKTVKVDAFAPDKAVTVIEHKQLLEPRGFDQRCEPGGEVADGGYLGHAERFSFRQELEIVAEECAASFVGKYEAIIHHRLTLIVEIYLRYLL